MKPAVPDGGLQIRIAGNDYYVPCPDEDKESLLDAARRVDAEIGSVKEMDSLASLEHCLLTVALNFAEEATASPAKHDSAANDSGAVSPERVAALVQKIDDALSKCV